MAKKKKRNMRGWQLTVVILFAATGFVQQVGVTATQVGQAATKVDHAIGAAYLINDQKNFEEADSGWAQVKANAQREITYAELESLRVKPRF